MRHLDRRSIATLIAAVAIVTSAALYATMATSHARPRTIHSVADTQNANAQNANAQAGNAQNANAQAGNTSATGGRACVFLAPKGANGTGHTGWAFRAGDDQHWYYGATQAYATAYIAPGDDNKAWVETGSWNDVLAGFASAADYHPAGYYTQYRCKDVATPNVDAAVKDARDARNWGYLVATNNCMDHAYRILKSYGTELPAPQDAITIFEWAPNVWFLKLGIPLIGGFEDVHDIPTNTGGGASFGTGPESPAPQGAEQNSAAAQSNATQANQPWWPTDPGLLNQHIKDNHIIPPKDRASDSGTFQYLNDRLGKEPNLNYSSAFLDETTATDLIGRALQSNSNRIQAWYKNVTPGSTYDGPDFTPKDGSSTGKGLSAGTTTRGCTSVHIALV
jgi:hypothetical protein